MSASFFWYDLETSGINPRSQRVMQFAGQRTDLELNPIGEPFDILIRLSDDVLPDPDAILLTGITPQLTQQEGLSEAEFLKIFYEQVAVPDTIFAGYNTVRFDDEFMRCLMYRNFYDPYEWQWKAGRSRWDLLDLVRMTRALRPEGIKWPFDKTQSKPSDSAQGKPTNRLELLTKANGLDHKRAHDALNDVQACIEVAKLIRTKQPKLFDWLLSLRGKNEVKQFIEHNPTFVYSSGRYSDETEKTAVVRVLHTDDSKGAIVYDLRHDPTEFAELSAEELAERWRYTRDPEAPKRLPVKTLKYNRCPALSPTGVLSDKGVQARLKVTPHEVNANLAKLSRLPELVGNIVKARDLLDDERGERWSKEAPEVDERLYDGFLDDHDRRLLEVVRAASLDGLIGLGPDFHDARMQAMLPLYKARNFSGDLTDEERKAWEQHRYHALMDGGEESKLAKYMHRLGELAESETGQEKRYLLEELQLYAESIMPVAELE